MLNRLRPNVKKFIDPLAKRINVNPNVLTILGLIVSILSGFMFAVGDLLLGAAMILLGGFVDMLDGAVARNNSSKTKFGGILDSTSDRFADAAIIIGIMYGGFVNPLIGALAIHASLTVSYVRARAESEGISCSVGFAERAERLIIVVAGAILSVVFHENMILYGAVVLIMILGYLTVFQRVYHSWKELKGQ
ncbi:archaetidylinositol phosphate synthase [Methanobacterium congolense]|jgi:archaetidylinositol phosphate synthase|uniref:Archaetidylinositol phosphate synthase n=1 Tax=Methanobacterium congolense TaxID=118062 RepID=A0A1D3L3R5_9EURY|nr:archaetidylinositol phosphate synthase [Methanobacterium congolense]SCG86195.1 Archaetidylinositol phosphate synthase [Methanobacterium congolense]